MAQPKSNEKSRAVELRRQGLSYREIRTTVPVAKSSLSLWLRGLEIGETESRLLQKKKYVGAIAGAAKLRADRIARSERIMAEAEIEALRRFASHDWLGGIGTALFWAEGSKIKDYRPAGRVSFVNMDPNMILFIRKWFAHACGVAQDDFDYALYIHETGNIPRAGQYWGEQLGISPDLIRIYLKRANLSTKRRNVSHGYHGTLRLYVRRSTALNYRIAGWLDAFGKALCQREV